ncbi:MMPL family transporter [Brevibacterium gallinarum]|uniref:MMPL family transporter n=1 Tax=Brevibacterium gallinarum TaxID=2762220 RepID=A0ABR8WY71_9MICO|nr:MMPL family transporter [Brevibacterium gallinarum]MBD8021939.1 MMPL family transporter [Brevibacterium gallinarum]
MSSFLYELGRTAFRRRKTVVAVWLAILAVLGGFVAAFGGSFNDEFRLPGSESQEALDSLELTFPEVAGGSATMLVVTADGQPVDTDPYKSKIEDTVEKIDDLPHVDGATSPFDEMIDGVINADGDAAIVNVQYDQSVDLLPDSAKDDLQAEADRLQAELPEGSIVSPGGELYTVTSVHISIIEAIGVVIAFIVLIFTLGSAWAAGMPLVTAVIGVGIGMLLILGSTAFATVNSTTPMLALMLGLAVGIDYALFIVSRARQTMFDGHDPEESAARAIATAGSAVVFAGVTVIIALVGLSVAGIPFLTVMGIAAAVTVAIAVAVALTVTPALLGFLGYRLVPKKHRPGGSRHSATVSGAEGVEGEESAQRAESEESRPRKPGFVTRFYDAWVAAATKIPLLTVVIVIAGLGALALPAKDLQLALPDNGGAEEGTAPRTSYDLISEHFGEGFNSPLVVTANIISSTDPLGDLDDMKADIEKIDGVHKVIMAVPNRSADTGLIQIIPEYGPSDERTTEVVKKLRDLKPHFQDEYGFDTSVTGSNAVAIDVSDQLGGALLPFGIFVVGLSLILLMMVFRSIAVPIKATLGFLLSVGAAFGLVTLVFVQGHGADIFGVEKVGPVISFLPIILMGILFGLAMDYEVFLVSGMREAFAHGASAKDAIHRGFQSSARVVVAAAIIMFAVFAAFVPAGDAIIKSIAFGLAVGIFIDAFIVRMTFVPAVMALLGDKAWWLPRWLERTLPHFDVEGEGLYHQVQYKDWPGDGRDYSVYGEDLGLDGSGRPVFDKVDLVVQPGEVLAVSGQGATALLLTIAGRATPDRGELKVLGRVLPEEAPKVRSAIPYMVLNSAEDALITSPGYLRHTREQMPDIVLIDRADQARDHDTAEAAQDLISAALAAGSSVLLGLGNRDADWMLPPQTHYRLLDLDAHNRGKDTAHDLVRTS